MLLSKHIVRLSARAMGAWIAGRISDSEAIRLSRMSHSQQQKLLSKIAPRRKQHT